MVVNVNTSDYALETKDQWMISVINNAPGNYACFLNATVTTPGEGIIGRGTSRSFKLASFEQKHFNRNSKDLLDSSNVSYSKYYRDALVQTGELPSRSYTVCVELLTVKGELLTKTCTDVKTQKYQPPVNIFPFNGDTLEAGPVSFQWLASQPSSPGFRYTLRIVELFNKQTAVSAFSTNPAVYSESGLAGVFFQYPVKARKLEEGKTYAWQIEAQTGTLVLRSEPTVFSVKPSKKDVHTPDKKTSVYRQYIDLRSRDIPRLHIVYDSIYVLIENKYQAHQTSFSLADEQQQILNKGEFLLNAGLNKISIPLGKIKPDQKSLYYLKLYGLNKNLPTIRFRILQTTAKK